MHLVEFLILSTLLLYILAGTQSQLNSDSKRLAQVRASQEWTRQLDSVVYDICLPTNYLQRQFRKNHLAGETKLIKYKCDKLNQESLPLIAWNCTLRSKQKSRQHLVVCPQL